MLKGGIGQHTVLFLSRLKTEESKDRDVSSVAFGQEVGWSAEKQRWHPEMLVEQRTIFGRRSSKSWKSCREQSPTSLLFKGTRSIQRTGSVLCNIVAPGPSSCHSINNSGEEKTDGGAGGGRRREQKPESNDDFAKLASELRSLIPTPAPFPPAHSHWKWD